MKRMRAVQILLVTAVSAGPVLAQIPAESLSASIGSGARALAMGGAFIAIADDATAASWNPAGLCVLEMPEASFAYQPAISHATEFSDYQFTREYQYDPAANLRRSYLNDHTSHSGHSVDFASFTYPIRTGSVKLVPQFSFQRTAYGLDRKSSFQTFYERPETGYVSPLTEWDDEYETSGGIDVYSASLGFTPSPKLYLGASFNWWRNGPVTRRTMRRDGRDSDTADYTHSYKGFNANIGVLVKPADKIQFGVVFKSPFDMSQTLDFSARGIETWYEEEYQRIATIRWPRTLGAGIAVLPSDALTLSFDITSSGWSEADWSYTWTDDYVDENGRAVDSGSVSNIIWPTGYDPKEAEDGGNRAQLNSRQIRFGTEYVILEPRFANLVVLPVRFGVFTDSTFFKASNLDAISYLGFSAGFGLTWSRVTLDFAYVRFSGKYRHHSNSYVRPDTPERGSRTVTYTQQGDDRDSSSKFVISTIVRFGR